jgi:hypothetical protein
MRGQADCRAAGRRRGPDVSAVSKGNAIAVNIRKAQEFGLGENRRGREQQKSDRSRCDKKASKDISLEQGGTLL